MSISLLRMSWKHCCRSAPVYLTCTYYVYASLTLVCAHADVCFDAEHTERPNAFVGGGRHCLLLVPAGIPFLAVTDGLRTMLKTAPLSHSHPTSGSIFKWSALISKWLGQISQWSDSSDFITDAVVSASSLTSFGEVNDLSHVTHLAAFIRQVSHRSRTLCGVFWEGSLKSTSGSRNWRSNVYSSTPAMLSGCPVSGGPSSGMLRSFLSWCY